MCVQYTTTMNAEKTIRKNELVELTAAYLATHMPDTHINTGAIYSFRSPNNTQEVPYIIVDTAPTHPQPDQDSQQKQSRYVDLVISIFYPMDKSVIIQQTQDNNNNTINTQADAYITARKSVNDVSDDIIETLYTKLYVQTIKMTQVAITNEGEMSIEEDAGGNPVMIYAVEVNTSSLLTVGS